MNDRLVAAQLFYGFLVATPLITAVFAFADVDFNLKAFWYAWIVDLASVLLMSGLETIATVVFMFGCALIFIHLVEKFGDYFAARARAGTPGEVETG